MPVANFEDFQVYCEAQDVVLRPELVDYRRDDEGKDSVVYSPTSLHKAIAAAGRLLRRPPIDQLASRPIKIDSRVLRSDTAALALARIVNGSMEPAYNGIDFDYKNEKVINACRSAEYQFTRAVLELGQGGNPNCQIIGNGTPVLLKKGKPRGLPSALALREITVNGVPYPAGSILRVDFVSDQEPSLSQPEQGVESVSLDVVRSVGFVRLSAFALEASERQSFDEALYDQQGLNPVRQITSEEIVQTVEAVYTPFQH